MFFEENEKKLYENLVVSNFFAYFAPRLVNIRRCSSVGQSSWFVISWSGVRIPPSAQAFSPINFGKIPEWPNGADCKSAGFYLRWFESISSHQAGNEVFVSRSEAQCGSSSVDRALAFQAKGREFEPRLPLSLWHTQCTFERRGIACVCIMTLKQTI